MNAALEDSTAYTLTWDYNETTAPDGTFAITIEGVANSKVIGITDETVSFTSVANASSQDFVLRVVVSGGSQGQFDMDNLSIKLTEQVEVWVGNTDTDLTDTGLTGDATLFSEDIVSSYSTRAPVLTFEIPLFATLQLDNVVVSQLNSYHVKQLNSGTTDETGLIQTQDIVMGNDPVFIRNFYLSYISSSVDVTVKVYLDNNALPAKTMTLDASSTIVNKAPILLNTSSEVLSLSFESAATDFTIEDMEIPDSEINPTD